MFQLLRCILLDVCLNANIQIQHLGGHHLVDAI